VACAPTSSPTGRSVRAQSSRRSTKRSNADEDGPRVSAGPVEAAALISGQIVFGDWASIRFKDAASSPAVGPDLEERQVGLDDHYEVQVIEPLIVKVGDQKLTFGAVERRLLSVGYELDDGEIVGRPLANDTAYRRYIPGQPAPDRNSRPVRGKYLGTRAEALEEQQ
jgi:hypothetical protein